MKKQDNQAAKFKPINVRTATTADLRALCKQAGQYQPGMHKGAMVKVAASIMASMPDQDKISEPDRVQIHRVRRAWYALERKTGKEVTLGSPGLAVLRATFPDFSDKGFTAAFDADLNG